MPKNWSMVFDSDRLFGIADYYSQRAQDHPHEAIATILLSAAAFEGFLNELTEWAALDSDGRVHDNVSAFAAVMEEAEAGRGQPNLKIQLMSSVFRGKPFDRGSAVYQDWDLLVKLRNAIVHLRPEKREWDDNGVEGESSQVRLVKRAKGRGLIPDGHPEFPWLDAISTGVIAGWAIQTSIGMAKQLVEMIPDGAFKLKMVVRSRDVFGKLEA